MDDNCIYVPLAGNVKEELPECFSENLINELKKFPSCFLIVHTGSDSVHCYGDVNTDFSSPKEIYTMLGAVNKAFVYILEKLGYEVIDVKHV